MAKIDKEASKKFGVKVVRSDKPKSETPKKKSWEKKIEKEDLRYIVINDDNNFIVREAEMIIDDYITNKTDVLNSYKQKNDKKIRIDLTKLLNFLLIISIIVCVIYFFVK